MDHPSKSRRTRGGLIALLATAATAAVCASAPTTPATAAPSVTPTMTTTAGSVVAVTDRELIGPDKEPGSGGAWISADGRYTTFQTYPDVVPGGRDQAQIFQYDRETGATAEIYGGQNSGWASQVSSDGRFVLVGGDAPDAIPGTTDGHRDVYQWDRSTGALTRVSQETGPHDPGASSYVESMTDDGRYVVFNSNSQALVDGVGKEGSNGLVSYNLFLWDRTTGGLTAITDGDGSSRYVRSFHGGTSDPVAMSDDGRYVTFHSEATDLVEPATAPGQIFQWDRVTGTTTAVTRGAGNSDAVAVSSDGRYVTIASKAPGPGPAGNVDLFQWDRTTSSLTRITDGDGDVWVDAVHGSLDGARITFTSAATDLVSGSTPADNAYQWDRASGSVTALSANGPNLAPRLWDVSDDGTRVLLGTAATSLAGGTDAEARSLYLWSSDTGTATAVTTGRVSWAPDTSAELSPDGRYVTYVDDDPLAGYGLVRGSYGGGQATIFQWDRTTGETIAAVNPDVDATISWPTRRNSAVSHDGATIAFWSRATNLAPGVTSTAQNLFVWDRTVVPDRPAQPRLPTAIASSGEVEVSWLAPLPNGSAAPTSYTVTPYADGSALTATTVAAPATSATIQGLANGTGYRFLITASNAAGPGAPSAEAWATPATVPGAPAITSVQVASRSATVTWTPPASDGGSPLSAFEVIATPEGGGDATSTWAGAAMDHATVTGLDNGTAYRFQVVARNNVGAGAASDPSAPVTVRPAGQLYVPMTPCRILDTRTSGTPMPLGKVHLVPTTGVCGLPAGARAIEASITAVTPTGSGFLRTTPSGYSAPNATVLTYGKGQSTTSTGALEVTPEAPKGLGMRVYGSPTHVVVDVQGYFIDPVTTPPGAVFVPVTPCRVVDTRTSGGALSTSATRGVQVRGRSSCPVPAEAVAIEATVSAVTPTGSGYLRAYPAGSPSPNATFLNYAKGQSTSNTGALALGPAGSGPDLNLRAFANRTHAVIDITGYFVPPSNDPVGATYVSKRACRLYDSRTSGAGPLAAGASRTVTLSRPGCNVPADAVAIEATITAVDPARAGYLRVHPPGVTPPTATFLNYRAGQSTTSTGALAIDDGKLVLRAFAGRTDVVVEVQGFYVADT